MILTGTEASRRALAEHFGLPNELIRIVPDAASAVFRPLAGSPDTREVLLRHGIDPGERFILYVGGISPHKNLATLIEAFAMLARDAAIDTGSPQLVVVGDYRGDVFLSSYKSLQRRIADLALTRRVIFTGFVPDDALVHLYNAADLMVLPSFDEGFGLPAVEAMACGTPVVASRAGALPEVVRDAGVFFDPHSPRELKECLEALMSDDAKKLELGRRGLIRAHDFSWERSATAALAALEELAKR
jgi:glycosyltransferase involved in cell wall biosynthesis